MQALLEGWTNPVFNYAEKAVAASGEHQHAVVHRFLHQRAFTREMLKSIKVDSSSRPSCCSLM